MSESELLVHMLEAAWLAGRDILTVYATEFAVERKDDLSPVTLADRNAEQTIISHLAERYPEIPAVSEETRAPDYESRRRYDRYWLIDPLDGTREFVKRNGEFTVNIALVVAGRPTLGVIYAPVTGQWYCGGPDAGAWRFFQREDRQPDFQSNLDASARLPNRGDEHRVSPVPARVTAAVSRSHSNSRAEAVFAYLEAGGISVMRVSKGSSLKFGLVAEGTADLYVRFGRTMEWDTAAGEAVVRGVGCNVFRIEDSKPLSYNKEDLANPAFFVCVPALLPFVGRALDQGDN